ncbi:MAG: ABC transporter permease subunit [Candidatus Micrarchaeia archaeon]
MDFEKSLLIASKDIKEVFSSITIYGPMVAIPLFFAIALPFLTFYVSMHAAPSLASKIFNMSMPASVLEQKSANNISFMSFFSIYVLGPIFLTMPIITASVIAADSFVGEKERRTSEALLSLPIKTDELLLGKILASFIPTIILTIAVFLIYGAVVDYLSYAYFHIFILPNTQWLLMLLSSPFFAIATIGLIVLVSSHVKGVKEAQQISTLLVLPILVMPFMSITGFAAITSTLLVYLIIFLAIADLAIVYEGIKKFNRESLI